MDIAPLIDVVFLLLIFFLLSSSFIMQPGIKIKLPHAKTSELQSRKEILILIDAKERIFLNERLVKAENLDKRLKEIVQRQNPKTAVIKADGEVRHARVVEVLDVAKLVGIERLAIATQIKEERVD